MTTCRVTQNDRTLDGFMAAKAEIDAMLESLKALSDDHFDTHPDKITSGHVGTLNHYASLLRQPAAPDHRQRLQGGRPWTSWPTG